MRDRVVPAVCQAKSRCGTKHNGFQQQRNYTFSVIFISGRTIGSRSEKQLP